MYSAANIHSRQSGAAGTGIYDRGLAERYTERLIAAFPPALADGPKPAAAAAAATDITAQALPRPIFICGMYRSGSTLTEQLLAGHPLLAAGGEIDFLPNAVQLDLAPSPESIEARLTQRRTRQRAATDA